MDADYSILDAVENTLMDPKVVERAIDHAIRALGQHRSEDSRKSLEMKLETVEKAVERLTNAVVEGGELEPLIEALRVQETRRQELLAEPGNFNLPIARPKDLRQQLEGYLNDWQGLLRSNVAQGQQALRRLIEGRLTLAPRKNHNEFTGIGTIQPMLGGLVQKLVPNGSDLERRFRMTRVL